MNNWRNQTFPIYPFPFQKLRRPKRNYKIILSSIPYPIFLSPSCSSLCLQLFLLSPSSFSSRSQKTKLVYSWCFFIISTSCFWAISSQKLWILLLQFEAQQLLGIQITPFTWRLIIILKPIRFVYTSPFSPNVHCASLQKQSETKKLSTLCPIR